MGGRGAHTLANAVLALSILQIACGDEPIQCGCTDDDDVATPSNGLCYNKGGCTALEGTCEDDSIQCGGCEYESGGGKIGAPPELFDLSGTGYLRGIRFRLKAYGAFEWTAATSCSVAESISNSIQLSSAWTVSSGVVDWVGSERLLTTPVVSMDWQSAAAQCESLGGHLATVRDYFDIRNSSSSTSPYPTPCVNCWAGLPYGQQHWVLSNGSSISPSNGSCAILSPDFSIQPADCNDRNTFQCFLYESEETSSETTLQLQFRAPMEPLAAVPRFSSLTEEEFVQLTVDVLMASLGVKLPLIPYGYSVTRFQNPDYRVYVRRFNIIYENTMLQYDSNQNTAVGVIKEMIGISYFDPEGWQLNSLKPETATSGKTIIVSYGITLHVSVLDIRRYLISDEELSQLLNTSRMNVRFQEQDSILRVSSIKELPGTDPSQTPGIGRTIVSPSDSIPVFLIVGVGAVSTILVAVYVVGTIRESAKQPKQPSKEDGDNNSNIGEEVLGEAEQNVLSIPRGSHVPGDNLGSSAIEVEMESIIESIPPQVSDPPLAARRMQAEREERGNDVLEAMARFGINPILNNGARAFPSAPSGEISLTESESQPAVVT